MRIQNIKINLSAFSVEDRKRIELLIRSVSSTIEHTVYNINDIADKYAISKSSGTARRKYKKIITPYIIHRAIHVALSNSVTYEEFEELLQELILVGLEMLERFAGTGLFTNRLCCELSRKASVIKSSRKYTVPLNVDMFMGKLPEASTCLEQKELRKMLSEMITEFSPRELFIVDMLYGFSDNHVSTYNEVSDALNISIERVKQIENKILRKLRRPYRAKRLKLYL